MPGKMSPDEVNAFLDSRPGWIALTTISKSGHPHTVPIGYFRKDDAVYIGCRAGTQKLKNIERNPKVSVMLEAGSTMQDIKGLLIQGDAEVILDPVEQLPLLRESMRQRGVPDDKLPSEARPDAAYIKVTPKKVISWDYARPS